MNQFLKRTFKGDRVVWFVFWSLFIISILGMFSASSSLVFRSGSIQGPIMRHIIFLIAGLCAILVIQLFSVRAIKISAYLGLVVFLILLAYTLAFGEEHQGASRFLSVFGIPFQPSEFAKITLIIVLADQIERCQKEEYKNKAFWWIILIIALICLLIFFENFSTAAILFTVTFIMMVIGEVNTKKMFGILGGIIVAVMLMLFIAWKYPDSNMPLLHRASTWVARIEHHFKPKDADYYDNDVNQQVIHSQIAIARGGFFPSMPGSSIERSYIPEAFSDFIFAILVEEGGLIFGIFVMLLYLILLYRAGVVARNANSLFGAILVIGVTLLIVIQAFIHIGVTINLGPVTGQPLPMISRGGSSIIVTSAYFGIIINITRALQEGKMMKKQRAAKEKENTIQVEETVDVDTEETIIIDK